ncbi:hypothetical protein OSTOST_06088, partial [Ostertagia ostertagi]
MQVKDDGDKEPLLPPAEQGAARPDPEQPGKTAGETEQDDPMITSLLMLAKDGGSMHRKEYLDEAKEIVQSVQNMTMKYGERRLIYREMCKPHCFGDEVFNAFTLFMLRPNVLAYAVRLAPRSFFINRYVDFLLGLLSFSNRNESIETQITNMEHVTLIGVAIYGNKDTVKKSTEYSLWELAAYEYSHQYNQQLYKNETLVEFLVFGNEILNMEINKANTKLSPYFGG